MDPEQLLNPVVLVLVPIAVVVVVLLGVAIAVVKVMSGKKAARQRKQWAQGAYSIWTGGEDCGTWEEVRAQKSLASWYGAKGPSAFWEVVAGLRRGRTGNIAWDRIRAIDLLRIGCAARFIDAEQCFTEAARIGVELQQQYRTWEDFAKGFEAGMLSWQQSSGVADPQETGRVQRNLPKLRQQIWPQVPYDARLAIDD